MSTYKENSKEKTLNRLSTYGHIWQVLGNFVTKGHEKKSDKPNQEQWTKGKKREKV
jgi:hypothetical protein